MLLWRPKKKQDYTRTWFLLDFKETTHNNGQFTCFRCGETKQHQNASYNQSKSFDRFQNHVLYATFWQKSSIWSNRKKTTGWNKLSRKFCEHSSTVKYIIVAALGVSWDRHENVWQQQEASYYIIRELMLFNICLLTGVKQKCGSKTKMRSL